MVAWIGAAAIGLLFANYPPIIVGPFVALGGGMDLSLITAAVAGAVLYLAALWMFPEPRFVFGATGSRPVPAADVTAQDVVADHGSAAARAAVRRAQQR